MGKYLKHSFALPCFLLLFFFLDGSVTNMILALVNTHHYKIVPAFLLITWILMPLYTEKRSVLYNMSFVIGFLYDSYYTGILGINLFLFPALVYVTYLAKRKLTLNFYTVWVWGVLAYFTYQHIICIVYRLLRFHHESYGTFFQSFLGPSLLFNSLIIFMMTLIIPAFCQWEAR
ncbi:rod shape-determining protein MreD [Aerococcus christensenii]|uniref:rod shape-determining protein MreD n=1 Tax=Aerococcus christensenii TaxID=87541 RepID=UPI00076328FA|nr:rod shape-determining protein MreD [Aerococcus christensenii]AMB92928.1 hypothetical protein AWM71_06395 [Aerococcus christensenii]